MWHQCGVKGRLLLATLFFRSLSSLIELHSPVGAAREMRTTTLDVKKTIYTSEDICLYTPVRLFLKRTFNFRELIDFCLRPQSFQSALVDWPLSLAIMFNVQNLLTPSTETVSAAVYEAMDVSPSEIKCDKEQTLKQSLIILIEMQ